MLNYMQNTLPIINIDKFGSIDNNRNKFQVNNYFNLFIYLWNQIDLLSTVILNYKNQVDTNIFIITIVYF